MDVSIIIVNYKTPELVIDCVNSIKEKTLDLEYEKRDENGKIEYEGISFVEDEFPAFLKQTISPIYKDEDYTKIETTGPELPVNKKRPDLEITKDAK